MTDQNPYQPPESKVAQDAVQLPSRKQARIAGKAVVIMFLAWLGLALVFFWLISPFSLFL